MAVASEAGPRPKLAVVIGAGVAGVQSARALLRAGFELLVLEQGRGVAGVWRRNYHGFALQVPYLCYTFAEFPYSLASAEVREKARKEVYPQGETIQDYISEYVAYYGLERHILYGAKVVHVGAPPGGGGRWAVRFRHAPTPGQSPDTGALKTMEADVVVAATGMYFSPYVPFVRGLASFKGRVMHARDFRSVGGLAGKRVLVLGAGKSAHDCSVVAASAEAGAASVTTVFRQAHWPLPREIFGMRFHKVIYTRFCAAMMPAYYTSQEGMAKRAKHALLSPLKRLFWRSLEGHVASRLALRGPLRPELGFVEDMFFGGQIQDGSWNEAVNAGRIRAVRGHLAEVLPGGVRLADGTGLDCDVIIFCTGYTKDYSIFDSGTISRLLGPTPEASEGLHLYRSIMSPRVPNLYFIGCEASSFNNILTSGLQSLWMLHHLLGHIALPPPTELIKDILDQQRWRQRVMPSQRHTSSVIMLYQQRYHDQLVSDMGQEPRRKRCRGTRRWQPAPRLGPPSPSPASPFPTTTTTANPLSASPAAAADGGAAAGVTKGVTKAGKDRALADEASIRGGGEWFGVYTSADYAELFRDDAIPGLEGKAAAARSAAEIVAAAVTLMPGTAAIGTRLDLSVLPAGAARAGGGGGGAGAHRAVLVPVCTDQVESGGGLAMAVAGTASSGANVSTTPAVGIGGCGLDSTNAFLGSFDTPVHPAAKGGDAAAPLPVLLAAAAAGGGRGPVVSAGPLQGTAVGVPVPVHLPSTASTNPPLLRQLTPLAEDRESLSASAAAHKAAAAAALDDVDPAAAAAAAAAAATSATTGAAAADPRLSFVGHNGASSATTSHPGSLFSTQQGMANTGNNTGQVFGSDGAAAALSTGGQLQPGPSQQQRQLGAPPPAGGEVTLAHRVRLQVLRFMHRTGSSTAVPSGTGMGGGSSYGAAGGSGTPGGGGACEEILELRLQPLQSHTSQSARPFDSPVAAQSVPQVNSQAGAVSSTSLYDTMRQAAPNVYGDLVGTLDC